MSRSWQWRKNARRSTQNSGADPGVIARIKLADLFALLRRRAKVFLVTVGGATALAAVVAIALPNRYTSTACILPSGSGDKMADLRSLVGFAAVSWAEENSSALYPTILRSRIVAESLMNKTFVIEIKKKERNMALADYLKTKTPDDFYKRLQKIISIRTDRKTGVISIAVTTRYASLSQAVANELLIQLENFNLHTRRSRARDNAEYLARELAQSETDMRQSEDQLLAFQSANRNWYYSTYPELIIELERLKRDVEVKTKKYLYLAQEYEAAKLEAHKDVPIVRLLDPPSLPLVKSGPHRGAIVIGTLLLTSLLLLVGMVGVELLKAGPDALCQSKSEDAFLHELTHWPIVSRFVRRHLAESVPLDSSTPVP